MIRKKNQVIFKFQGVKLKLCVLSDSLIHLIFKWLGVPDFEEGQVEK